MRITAGQVLAVLALGSTSFASSNSVFSPMVSSLFQKSIENSFKDGKLTLTQNPGY